MRFLPHRWLRRLIDILRKGCVMSLFTLARRKSRVMVCRVFVRVQTDCMIDIIGLLTREIRRDDLVTPFVPIA